MSNQQTAPVIGARNTGEILDDAALHRSMLRDLLQKAVVDNKAREDALKSRPPKGQKAPTVSELNTQNNWISGGHFSVVQAWNNRPKFPMATDKFRLLCEIYSTHIPSGPYAENAKRITGRGGSTVSPNLSPEVLKLLGLAGQQQHRRG